MAPNSLFPTALRIFYRTPNAPHVMTIPLTVWSPISGGHVAGTCLAWDGSQADVDTMVLGLKDLLKPFWGSTTTFTSYEIDTFATPTSPARPQVALGMTSGAGTGSGGIPAAQATFNFKTTAFGTFKLVMLDAKVSATFQPLDDLVSPADDDEIALRDYLRLDANAFAGRDGNQLAILKRITYTLNEKLRAEYRLN
jgi:hypothetical protein